MLQYSETIGPLIKILGKMSQDFSNFFVIYCVLLVMYAIVGNMNFLEELEEFHGMFTSILTVIDASIGNYDL